MAGHFFSTRKGREFRDFILQRDGFTCQMCGVRLMPGKDRPDSAVVDHIRPVYLRPDLGADPANCRAVCVRCHAACNSIEQRHKGDEAAIVRAKLSYRPVGLDGYPVGR